TQHELDDDEIPSVEIPIDQSSTVIENNNISNELKSNIIDTRPLTKLETPYEQNPTKESLNSLPDVVPEKKHDDSVSQTEPDDILGNKSVLKE
ncbi:unnamed protein product, partial [Rotaria sordida]